MTRPWKVLITAPHLRIVLSRFHDLLNRHGIEPVVPEHRHRLEEAELVPLVADIDGVICGDDAWTEAVLEAAPQLKVISMWGIGIDAIDLAAAARRGIVVRNTPAALADPVADTVLGYVLCFARALIWLDRGMKQGRWERLPARSLRECTLGVIGAGSIGKAVIRRAAAFGMRAFAHDIVEIDPALVEETGVQIVPLEDLLAESDFVSLNCTLTPQTYHLIGARALARMRPDAVLINTARGTLVDEPALIAALQRRQIAGAALDVFEVEPLPDSSPLRAMDSVLLGPHAANASPAAFARIHEQAIANLVEELERWGR